MNAHTQTEHEGWIGVDLDGTLALYDEWRGIEHIGAPIPLMVQRVKDWLAEGREVRIFTARVGPQRADVPHAMEQIRAPIERWCLEHLGCVLPVTSQKDYDMAQLWDDRCVQVVYNTGMPIQQALGAQVVALREVLKDCANPLAALQRGAEATGDRLNGAMAIDLANDAEFIKSIARKGLDQPAPAMVAADWAQKQYEELLAKKLAWLTGCEAGDVKLFEDTSHEDLAKALHDCLLHVPAALHALLNAASARVEELASVQNGSVDFNQKWMAAEDRCTAANDDADRLAELVKWSQTYLALHLAKPSPDDHESIQEEYRSFGLKIEQFQACLAAHHSRKEGEGAA